VHLDVVEEQPLDQPVGLGVAALAGAPRITYACGKSSIQLLATSKGGGQHAGRGASASPRW
jgi:hypothetical protein